MTNEVKRLASVDEATKRPPEARACKYKQHDYLFGIKTGALTSVVA
jgi:hypothetical protein